MSSVAEEIREALNGRAAVEDIRVEDGVVRHKVRVRDVYVRVVGQDEPLLFTFNERANVTVEQMADAIVEWMPSGSE